MSEPVTMPGIRDAIARLGPGQVLVCHPDIAEPMQEVVEEYRNRGVRVRLVVNRFVDAGCVYVMEDIEGRVFEFPEDWRQEWDEQPD